MVNPEPEIQELSRKFRRRGAIILALFAAVWAALGASAVASPAAAIGVDVAAVVLTCVALALSVRSGSSAPTRRRALPANWNRSVGLVNLTELVLIVAAVVSLNAGGETVLIPPVICLIVGVHFLPLARLFSQPQYNWTGGLLGAVAVIGLVVVTDGSGSGTTRAVVGFGAAAVLWGSSLHVAIRG